MPTGAGRMRRWVLCSTLLPVRPREHCLSLRALVQHRLASLPRFRSGRYPLAVRGAVADQHASCQRWDEAIPEGRPLADHTAMLPIGRREHRESPLIQGLSPFAWHARALDAAGRADRDGLGAAKSSGRRHSFSYS